LLFIPSQTHPKLKGFYKAKNMHNSQIGSFHALSTKALNCTQTFSTALVLGGLTLLLLAAPASAQIGIQDGPSPIEYTNATTTATFATNSFTVSSGASALVVFYGSRTQGTSPGTDPGTPATISWNGHAMTRAVTQSDTAATWDDNAIYYLMNPPAGTGKITGTIPTDENQVFWMAYTLTNATVFTSGSPLTGTAFTTSGTTINNTVANVVAGSWAAVNTSGGAVSSTLTITASPAGVTVLPNVASTHGNATQNMGSVSNCPAGSVQFTSTDSISASKMVLCEAVFAPAVLPQIVKQPDSLSLYSGGIVHFSVTANFTSGYQWLSNNVPLAGATNSTLAYGSGSASLVAGVNYSVVLTNIYAIGSVTSTVATVSIRTPTEAYETAVAALGPYAFYQFNETANPLTAPGGATAFDNANSFNGIYGTSAENGFNGIVGPTPVIGLPGFNSGNAAFMPQTSVAASTVTLQSPLNLNTNTVTIAAWVYPTAAQSSAAGLLMCRGTTTVAGLAYTALNNGTDYSLGYVWDNDPNTYNWNSQLYVPQNQWSLVAVAVTPTNATIYVLNTNGIVSAQHVYPHGVQSFNGTTTIGGDSLSNLRAFTGTIDDVAVFNQALTPAQLTGLFYTASGASQYPPIVMTPPANQTVYAGQTATFTVVGGGSAPLAYQWQSDDGFGNFTNIYNNAQFSGANGPTLTFNNATNVNAVNYRVILTNTWGNVTSTPPASLTIIPPVGPAMNITMTVQQGTGTNWDTPGWWIDGVGSLAATVSAAEYPGSTYELLAGARMRSSTTNANSTFPGVRLTVDGNGVWINNPAAGTLMAEIRMKGADGLSVNYSTVNFPKLVMNGGQIDVAPDTAFVGYMTIGGEMDINANTPIYNDGANGDGAGVYLSAWLTGSSTFEYHGDTEGSIAFTNLTSNLNIANATNTFSGQWNIVSGILLGSAPGSLGTNTILIGSAAKTNAALETTYNLNNPNGNLVLYGQMFLHQNDTFQSVFINGIPLAAGTYSFATLNSTYPAYFPATWPLQLGSTINTGSGQITVLVSPAPVIVTQPQPLSLYPGQTATFGVSVVGNTPLVYQWFTNNTVALNDDANRIGSATNVLTIPAVASADAGNYTVIVTNSFGSVTSIVASLTVLTTGPAENFTLDLGGTPIVELTGSDWNSINYWNPGGQPASLSAYANPGSTYEVVVGSRLRTPAGTNNNVFPGVQLTIDGGGVLENGTLNAVGELRFKNNSNPATNYFADLILNGGQLDHGDNTLEHIQGLVTVTNNSTIYVDSSANVDRGYQIDAWLTDSGNLLWHEWGGGLGGTNLQITCATNTFTGQWIVDQGALIGVGVNSLGTNNITVGNGTNVAAVETLYDMNDTNASLTLGTNGRVFLHQNDQFFSVTVNGTSLNYGTYPIATLHTIYPLNFPTNWTLQAGSTVTNGSGQIFVMGNPQPTIVTNPQPLSLYPGQTATFSVAVNGAPPFGYQWFTNNGTVALSDDADRIGSTTNVLTIPSVTFTDGADYTVVVTNSYGSVTSIVATLTVLTPGSLTNFTLDFTGPVVEGIGSDWNSLNSWNPDGLSALVSAEYANPGGSTFEVVVGSRLRTPLATNYSVFPGVQLTIDGGGVFENDATVSPVAVGELRFKNNNTPMTNYFADLVLNGGQLDNGGNAAGTSMLEDIQGELNVSNNSTIYVDSSAGADRGYQIDAWLTGSGNLFWHESSGGLGGTNLQITCATNTFTGQWIVDQGALVGGGVNSLGTNNIIVGTNGLTAAVETMYNINDPSGSLILGATGELFLHQNDQFASVTVNGVALANGTYSFATLNSAYPTNFPATWSQQAGSTFTAGSGRIIVGNVPPSPPQITSISVLGTTLAISATNGVISGQFVLLGTTNLALPLAQWTPILTNSFDGSGNLNLSTNILNSAAPQEFYRLSQ